MPETTEAKTTTTTKPAAKPAARATAERSPDSSPEKSESLLDRFLKASGYKANDVDGQNDRTRTFVTTNGGKYQLLRSGKVRRLQGPFHPKFEPESGE